MQLVFPILIFRLFIFGWCLCCLYRFWLLYSVFVWAFYVVFKSFYQWIDTWMLANLLAPSFLDLYSLSMSLLGLLYLNHYYHKCKVFTITLAHGFSLESEWQRIDISEWICPPNKSECSTKPSHSGDRKRIETHVRQMQKYLAPSAFPFSGTSGAQQSTQPCKAGKTSGWPIWDLAFKWQLQLSGTIIRWPARK